MRRPSSTMRKRCTCADRTGLTSPTLRHGSKVNHPRRPAVLRRGAREPFEPRCHGEHARALQTAGHASLLRYHGGSDRNTPWSRQRHPVREPPAPAARSKAFGSANSFLYSTAALLPCVRATNSRARGAGTTLECTDSFGTGNGQQDDKSVMFEPVRRRVDAPSLMWTEKSSRPPRPSSCTRVGASSRTGDIQDGGQAKRVVSTRRGHQQSPYRPTVMRNPA